MDNQHKLIKGYRDLSQEEIDQINRLKALGLQLKAELDIIEERVPVISDKPHEENPRRALAIARTELQTGMMWLIRAVAQPAGF